MELVKTNIELVHIYGNRCNHVLDNPRFYERPKTSKPTYDILETAKLNLQNYYFRPGKWLEHVEFSRETSRQQRSESREAVAAVSQVLFDHVDLTSLKIVQHIGKGVFKHISVKTIANKAKVGYRRCFRALETLKRAGYLELKYRRTIDKKGNLVPLVAIKKLSRKFFVHLGVTMAKLHKCSTHSKKQLTKFLQKTSKQARKAKFKIKKLISTIDNKNNKQRKSAEEQKKLENAERRRKIEQEKQKIERMIEIKSQIPDITEDELRIILNKEFIT